MLTEHIVAAVVDEYERAAAKFAKFNSAHEGYAVLLEEVTELQAEVFSNPSKKGQTSSERDAACIAHQDRMREEAVQVAAMAFRFINDITE